MYRDLDLETLQRLGEPFELGSDVSFQELRRAGDTVLLAGVDKNGRARLWDAVARAELVRPIFLTEAGPVAAGIVDGLPILAAADEGHQIILSKDTSEPRRWAVPNRSEELITCLRIDTFEGRPVLLAGTDESSVFVWDLRTGKPAVQTLVGHSSTVVDVRVVNIAGVQSLVSTDLGGEVRRWFPGKADASEPVVPKYRAIALGKIQERDIVAAITNNCIRHYQKLKSMI